MPEQRVPNALVLDVASTLAEHGHDVFSRAVELRAMLARFLRVESGPDLPPAPPPLS